MNSTDATGDSKETAGGDEFDDVWKALSNRTRRQILDLLVEGALTTGELAERFGELSRFAVMQHLQVLEHSGLVVARRSGRTRFNHLNPVPIQQISDRWISRYQRPFAEALVDLKLSVEAGDQSRHTRRDDIQEAGLPA